MKIYTKVVISMITGEVLEDESYEYDGPLALCDGGGSSVEAPLPTSTENAIQGLQYNNMLKSASMTDALMPGLLESQGYKTGTPSDADKQFIAEMQSYIANAEENKRKYPFAAAQFDSQIANWQMEIDKRQNPLIKMSDEERYNSLSDLEKMQYDVSKLQSERTMKALKGELPISPALEKSLADQEASLRSLLSQKLGSDYELSTPGQNALKAFTEKADLVREEARRGEISQGTSLMLSNLGYQDSSSTGTLGNLIGLGQSRLPYTSVYNSVLQPYQQQRQMQYQADATNAAAASQRSAGLMGAIGTSVGTAAGLAAMSVSDIRLKHNVVYL